MRIIFVPQYPTPMRYQEWWWNKFPEEFADRGFDVKILGAEKVEEMKHRRGDLSMFSPIHAAIELECAQIDEYMDLKIEDDDILFMADISFPGLFGNVLFHKRPKKCFGFCHATSLNYKDYFEKNRDSKFLAETSTAKLMNKVFVGSKYHKDKLGWHDTIITSLPYPPVFEKLKDIIIPKKIDIISASRNNPQKIDKELEDKVEKIFGEIRRPSAKTWFNYQWNLRSSKVLLITSFEDTFGYQIVDAVMNGCIPLAPMRCSYPELLPRRYLYKSEAELMSKLDYFINSDVEVPTLLCDQKMKDFYETITDVMSGNTIYPF
jgi:hypothetical protein